MAKDRILVVEDEHIVALDIKMHLEKYGYDVPAMFPSGEEALIHFQDVAPVLVLMDIKLQGQLDGLDTAREIKRRYNTPVILLTAYADETTIQRAKLTQPFAYIIKPFEERELRTAIVIALYRHQMEQEVRRREKLFSTTLNSIGDGVVVTSNEGLVEFVNPVALRILGKSEEECKGKPLTEVLQFREETENGYDYLLHKEGTELPVETTVSPLVDENGAKTGTVWAFRDISERLESEHALAESTEQLRHAQKMEAVGRLSGGIAHDFNNLLTVIMGYTRLIRQELASHTEISDIEAVLSDLDGVQKAATKSVSLTRQLLAFSRHQVLEPGFQNLNEIIQELEKMIRRLLTEQVRMYLSLRGDPATVFVDQGQIEQVLMNLVVNARDAMADGGTLTIRTRNKKLTVPLSTITGEVPPGDYICLQVADSGSGMSKDTLNRVFEPFFTTKASGQGTGLGLSTVWGIVRQSNGHIHVDSAPGQGSTFHIYLPLSEGAAAKSGASPVVAAGVEGSETVLVVEDDQLIRSMLARVLRGRGYTAIEAQNAGEAFLICEDRSVKLDLMVSDVVMPHITGNKLADRVQEIRPELRILLISGYPEGIGAREKEKMHVRFIQKPFEPEDFLRQVREILDS